MVILSVHVPVYRHSGWEGVVYIKHFRFSVRVPYLDIICNIWFLLGTILCDNTTSENKSKDV